MKKLYVVTTALAVALSASATDLTVKQAATFTKLSSDLQATQTVQAYPTTRHFAAPAKAAAKTMDELVGTYTGTVVEYVTEDQKPLQLTAEVTVVATGENTVNLEGFFGHYGLPNSAKATVDFAKGTISIAEQDVCTLPIQGKNYDISLVHMRWAADGKSYGEAPGNFVVQISEGGLEFDQYDLFWMDAAINGVSQGYIGAFGLYSLEKAAPEADPYAPWNEIEGTGVLVDPWIIPCTGNKPTDFPVEVVLERSSVNANVIRIVNPYAHPMFSQVNTNVTQNGCVVLDLTDPNCVLVLPGYYSGFTNSQAGGKLYLYNFAGWILDPATNEVKASTTKEVLDLYKANDIPASTYSNGEIKLMDCVFGDQSDKLGAYTWQDVDMIGSLTLPAGFEGGIGDILADEAAGAVEYFNLQGQKVENPSAGLYIRRQGNKAIKVLVK